VRTVVYDDRQYAQKQYMAPPIIPDLSKKLISQMPGGVISILVEEGQTVLDGQDLMVIEAMKMQNILKSSIDGVIKSIMVKEGDNVQSDQLLLEFE
jgi:propionyl-CoA carboxylase alpha chain